MNIQSILSILMAWWFSTRASVATVLSRLPCMSSFLRIKATLMNGLRLDKNALYWSCVIFFTIWCSEMVTCIHRVQSNYNNYLKILKIDTPSVTHELSYGVPFVSSKFDFKFFVFHRELQSYMYALCKWYLGLENRKAKLIGLFPTVKPPI